jgi:hypothetical protein
MVDEEQRYSNAALSLHLAGKKPAVQINLKLKVMRG